MAVPEVKLLQRLPNFSGKVAMRPFLRKADNLKREFYLQERILEDFGLVNLTKRQGNQSYHIVPDKELGKPNVGTLLYYLSTSVTEELDALRAILKRGSYPLLRNFLFVNIGEKITHPFGQTNIDGTIKKLGQSFTCYQHLFESLSMTYEQGSQDVIGTPLQDSILDILIRRTSTFSRKSITHDYDEIGDGIKKEFADFAVNLKKVHDFDFEGGMRRYVAFLEELRQTASNPRKCPELEIDYSKKILPINEFHPSRKIKARSLTDARLEGILKETTALKRYLHDQPHWENIGERISNYQKKVYSFSEADLLTLHETVTGQLVLFPKTKRKEDKLDDIVGYDKQKELLCLNTEKLLDGQEANNIFMWGPPGTGKSTLTNGLLTEYKDRNLRMIEIPKEAAPYIDQVFDQIEQMPEYSFIIHIDDISIGSEEDTTYFEGLKKVMEGSFEGLPKNAVIYAVSNDESALKPPMGIHNNKDGNEDLKRSLEDRFGIMLEFLNPNEKETEQIFKHHYTHTYKGKQTHEEAWKGLTNYLESRKIDEPNGRNIRDYIKTLN